MRVRSLWAMDQVNEAEISSVRTVECMFVSDL